jgi:hypothetical protein
MLTREQYIQIKTAQPIEVVYEFYKEHVDTNKHKFLSFQEFFTFIQLWRPLNVLFEKVCAHYDEKFSIIKLLNKEGGIIKYL